jgi:hypothetical protein
MAKDDLDALFKLPLAEFTVARNALAAQLKKSGHAAEAENVKALAKPPVSAWAVNQLYWKHREPFDRLIAAGQRFRQVQSSASKSDIAESVDARRKALSDLSRFATELLRDGGHNPSPDLIRRITTTLEAISAYPSLTQVPDLGRLTHDLDPPGFDVLAGAVPGKARETSERSASVIPFDKSRRGSIEDTRRAKVAAAEATLLDAELALGEVRARAEKAASTLKKAETDAQEADNDRRTAEEQLKKAIVVSVEAEQRARMAAAAAREAARDLENATRRVEKAAHDLETLRQEGPVRS